MYHFAKARQEQVSFTTGVGFFDLFTLFQKYLGKYCTILQGKLKSYEMPELSEWIFYLSSLHVTMIPRIRWAWVSGIKANICSLIVFEFILIPSVADINKDDDLCLRVVCGILNTSEYCCVTTVDVETNIKQAIDERFKSKISLKGVVDSYEKYGICRFDFLS